MTMVQYLTPPLTKQVHALLQNQYNATPLSYTEELYNQMAVAILFYGQIWLPSQGLFLYSCQAKWIYPSCAHVYGVNWSVEFVCRRCLSLCLLAQVLQIQGVFSLLNTLQTVRNVGKTALYVIRFARCTLQMFKSFWVSIMGTPIDYPQMLGHMLNVQHETTVSVFLGFTLQHAFVRQSFFYLHGSICA